MEIVLVIDRSGSMSGYPLAMARQAGVAAVQAMRADSKAGLVAFSGHPDTVIPPVKMSHSAWLIGVISSLNSGGGTDIASALSSAGGIMSNDPRYLHHIILLSDGISSHTAATMEAQMIASRGITISTISLGGRNNLMADVAKIGRGRYHVAHDPSKLPNLFVREARYRQAPPHKEGNFRLEVAENMDFLDGVDFSSASPITGYVLADSRPEAKTVLRSADGDPLLAHWNVEEGQVATFTSATSGRWANGWRTHDSFSRMFSQMAWEMLRERSQADLEMRVDAHPSLGDIDVITVATLDFDPEDEPVVLMSRNSAVGRSVRPSLAPHAPSVGPFGFPLTQAPPITPLVSPPNSSVKPVELVRRGPGLWQGMVERADGFLATGHFDETDEPINAVGVDNPYPREISSFGTDNPTLVTLADRGGGRVVEDIGNIMAPGGSVPTMIRFRLVFLILALILYLTSVLLLRLPQNLQSGAARRSQKSKKKTPKAKKNLKRAA